MGTVGVMKQTRLPVPGDPSTQKTVGDRAEEIRLCAAEWGEVLDLLDQRSDFIKVEF